MSFFETVFEYMDTYMEQHRYVAPERSGARIIYIEKERFGRAPPLHIKILVLPHYHYYLFSDFIELNRTSLPKVIEEVKGT